MSDPPILAFLEKKSKGFPPKKARVFLFAEPLKSLEKEEKRTKKQGKSENEKSQEIEKSKVLLLLRFYFPEISVAVTVLKFGWIHLITITVTVLESAVTPSFTLILNYRLESHLN